VGAVFDVGIVGLGAMGSATAFQLARKGSSVLGIDQFSPPHTLGSSHGATRVTRQAIGEGEQYVPLVLRSYELWRELESLSGEQLLSITGGVIMANEGASGNLHGSNKFLDQTVAAARKFGIDHELLTSEQIRTRFPQFQLVGDERGYYEPLMGFLRPEICIQTQLALAEKLGEEVIETATSGEDEAEDVFNQIVTEENGGPFLETSGGTEFAHGTDASNIAGATREPFPRT